jgi:hypothetical protein
VRRQCCSPMTEERGYSVPTAREACKHLRLPVIDDAIESLHMLNRVTGRCLPAVAPRVLVMGDEVRARSFSLDNHFTPLFKSQTGNRMASSTAAS